MRSIQISTEVFAAIWAARQPGEDTEDQVLCRIFHIKPPAGADALTLKPAGFASKRYKFSVPEGFRIERNFKGRDYEAQATSGGWKLDGSNRIVSSPSALSDLIGTGVENVWNNWFYVDPDGKRRPISDLRNPETIRRRGD